MLLICLALFFGFAVLVAILSAPSPEGVEGPASPAGGSHPTSSPSQTAISEPTISPTATVFEQTPTPTVVPHTPTAGPEAPIFYTVQPGETLSQIAAKFNLETESLALANHISDINMIFEGQQLLIASIPITVPEATISEGKQIIVVLSTQRAYAFENGVLQKEFIVATGVAAHPTVTGRYAIYVKLEKTDMSDGITYDIKDVPWTMYFHLGYGLHGAPWNNNLGTPGSHGCVNMSVEDADWLFHWAEVGTPVLVLP